MYDQTQKAHAMAWEKTFDVEDAISRATAVFWDKGYAASSMANLTQAMGINKGSLYNAFGSKKKLFARVLTQYDRNRTQATLKMLNQRHAPLPAIVGMFDIAIERNCANPDNKGCLLVNTALDLPHHDKDIQDIVIASMDEVRGFFAGNIMRGQDNGSISPKLDAKATAYTLHSLLIGLQVLARGACTPECLHSIKEHALQLLQS